MLSKHVIWDVWNDTNTFLSDYPSSWKPNRNIYFLINIQIRKSSRLHLPSLQKQKKLSEQEKDAFVNQNYTRNRLKHEKPMNLAIPMEMLT